MTDEVPGPGHLTMRSLSASRSGTRDTEATQSAWRMEIESDAGRGAIMLVDLPGGQAVFRGEGALLGWTQDQLAEAFHKLRPTPDEPPLELQQLG